MDRQKPPSGPRQNQRRGPGSGVPQLSSNNININMGGESIGSSPHAHHQFQRVGDPSGVMNFDPSYFCSNGQPPMPFVTIPPPGFVVGSGGMPPPPGYPQVMMQNPQIPAQQNYYAKQYQPQQQGLMSNHHFHEELENGILRQQQTGHQRMSPVHGAQDPPRRYSSSEEMHDHVGFNNNVGGANARDIEKIAMLLKMQGISNVAASLGFNGGAPGLAPTSNPSAEQQQSSIKPLIDNIVGSMMCNGTYTHFGPSGGLATLTSPSKLVNSEASSQNDFATLHSTPYFSNEQMCGTDFLVGAGRKQDSPTVLTPTGNPVISSGRASTPSDGAENSSRPQTPSKPSYSEILAKNTNANNQNATSSSVKTAAGVSNPVHGKNSAKDVTPVNIKKSDISSGSSGNSSSCASGTCSPVVKQKTLSQAIMGRLFTTTMTGKENSSSRTPPSRTPSSTPTHQRKTQPELKGDERKALSSQNTFNLRQQKQKQTGKPTKVQTFADFDVDSLQEEEKGWTTFSRSKSSGKIQVAITTSNRPSNSCSESSTSGQAKGSVPITSSEDVEDDVNDSSSLRRDSMMERKSSSATPSGSGGSNAGTGTQINRKGREKEKTKSRRDGKNCATRMMERYVYLWAATMISAAAWLLKLVTDVVTLSVSVGSTLVEDLVSWWSNRAVPSFLQQIHAIEETIRVNCRKLREKITWDRWPFRRKCDEESTELKRSAEDLLAALGPEKNIQLTNADETLKRLLSCKGQDPYSILGVRSDSSDETIRRYYKKQAVLVHPDKNLVVGAEEAFKILGKAFEIIGEPSKRQEYHNKLIEAHTKEQVYGEIGKLLEQLRKKMEYATSSIRCTKCNLRHKKNKTDRPLFAARYCAQCNIHHAAREGELWAETKGWFGLSWTYFTCMDCHVWEINEWAKCQKKNLLHIKADSHCVMYRLVAGAGNNGGQNNQQGQGMSEGLHADPEDDWDSLINNLYKTGGVPGSKTGDHFYQQGNNTGGGYYSGTGNNPSSSTSGGRKRKGKRK